MWSGLLSRWAASVPTVASRRLIDSDTYSLDIGLAETAVPSRVRAALSCPSTFCRLLIFAPAWIANDAAVWRNIIGYDPPLLATA